MALDDYHDQICRLMGLALSIQNSDVLNIGTITPAELGVDAVASFIERRRDVTLSAWLNIEKFNAGKLSPAEHMELSLRHVPISYQDFLEIAPLFSKAILSQQELDRMGDRTDSIRSKVEAILGIAEYDEGTPMLLKEHFVKHIDQVTEEVGRSEGVNINRLFRDLKDQINIHSEAFPLELRDLIKRGYNVSMFTPDLPGYLAYLEAHLPTLHKALHTPINLRLAEEDRRQHTYVVGTTGSGKTELLKLLVRRTVENNQAIVVIDPHGDMAAQIAHWDWFEDDDQLVYIDPFLFEGELTPTINPLNAEGATDQDRELIADQLTNMFEELLKGTGGDSLTTHMRVILKPCLQLLIDEKPDATLRDLQNLLHAEQGQDLRALGKKAKREHLRDFFLNRFDDPLYVTTKSSISSKVQNILGSQTAIRLFQGRTSLNLEALIDQRKTIVFNLSKGRLGDDVSEAFGRFILAHLQALALRRDRHQERVPVHVIVDEAQTYVDRSIERLLTEARKYGVYLTLAQPQLGLGMSNDLTSLVLNNTNLKLVGRVPEGNRLGKVLGVSPDVLQSLPTGRFMCRIKDRTAFPFSTHSHLINWSFGMSEADWAEVKERQRRHYRSIDEVAAFSASSNAVIDRALI
jgi:energy-coupling factor transporter ATP-binding protein EcfA2